MGDQGGRLVIQPLLLFLQQVFSSSLAIPHPAMALILLLPFLALLLPFLTLPAHLGREKRTETIACLLKSMLWRLLIGLDTRFTCDLLLHWIWYGLVKWTHSFSVVA